MQNDSTRKRAHRGTGEGAIYREPNGLWAAAVELGQGPDGRRLRRKVRGRTKGIVLDKLTQMKSQAAAGSPVVDNRRSPADYLRWWSTDVLPGSVKDSTADDYRWILDHYVIPHLGHVPLGKLAPQHVHQMLRRLEDDGKSPRSRQYARAVLRRALGYAERWDMVTRNAAALVDDPRIAGSRLDDTLSPDQAKELLAAAKGTRLEALAVLVLRLGLRKGEALALLWDDVDLDAGRLQIHATLKRRPGQGLVRDVPKTSSSRRTLPLPSNCAAALRAHQLRQHAERQSLPIRTPDKRYVFTSPVGTPIDPRNVNRWWDQLCESAGIGHHRARQHRHHRRRLRQGNC